MSQRPAVVLGASPTGLAVVRALGVHGVPVHVADFSPDRPAFSSRYRTGNPITGPDEEQIIAQIVEQLGNSDEPPVAIPTSDAMVLALVKYRDLYRGKLRVFPSIESGLSELVTDKASFYQQCLDTDTATAKTAFPKSVDEILKLGKEFQFPLLLKPIFGHLWRERLKGNKLIVANHQNELEQIVSEFGDDADGLMVQELIPGGEKNIWVGAVYRGTEGQRHCCFVAQKVRQYPVDFGSASYCVSKYVPEIEELSWKFLDGVDYRGICGTEFKFDERDQQYKMIEVNPRPTLWFHIVKSAHVDLIYAAYCELAGQPVPKLNQQKEGVAWCFHDKDMMTWLHHLRHLDISPFELLTTLSPLNHGAVINLSDPMPFLRLPSYYARRMKERLFGKNDR